MNILKTQNEATKKKKKNVDTKQCNCKVIESTVVQYYLNKAKK